MAASSPAVSSAPAPSSLAAASSVLPCAPYSPAPSISIGSAVDGSEERRREKNQSKIQEKKIRRRRTQGKVFGQVNYLCQDLQLRSRPPQDRRCCPLPESSPLPESAPLPGTPPLAALSKQMALRDQLPGAPDVAALLLHKSTSKISTKKKALKRARQQKAKL